MTKNADPDSYSYSRYGIGFNARGRSSLSEGSGFGKNVIIFGVDNSSSVHAGNRKNDVLILRKGPKNGVGDTTIKVFTTNENFSHYSVSSSFFFFWQWSKSLSI